MLIYKYTSGYAGKQILSNSSVRFSQVAVLNDPFELAPSLARFKRSLKSFLRKQEDFRVRARGMALIEQEAALDRICQPSLDELEKQIRRSLILSLTPKADNPLMWAHYADSYRGVVIGFDFENHFFHQVENPGVTKSYKVLYSDQRPEFFEFEKFWEMEVRVDAYRNMLLTKELKWSYEEEIRMFADPDSADHVKQIENADDIYLFEVPKEAVNQVIFGSRMKDADKLELADIANLNYPNVELFDVIEEKSGYGLRLIARK